MARLSTSRKPRSSSSRSTKSSSAKSRSTTRSSGSKNSNSKSNSLRKSSRSRSSTVRSSSSKRSSLKGILANRSTIGGKGGLLKKRSSRTSSAVKSRSQRSRVTSNKTSSRSSKTPARIVKAPTSRTISRPNLTAPLMHQDKTSFVVKESSIATVNLSNDVIGSSESKARKKRRIASRISIPKVRDNGNHVGSGIGEITNNIVKADVTIRKKPYCYSTLYKRRHHKYRLVRYPRRNNTYVNEELLQTLPELLQELETLSKEPALPDETIKAVEKDSTTNIEKETKKIIKKKPRKKRGFFGSFLILCLIIATMITVLMVGVGHTDKEADEQYIPETSSIIRNDSVITRYYQDEFGWIEDCEILLEGLDFFYNTTRISPYIVFEQSIGTTENDQISHVKQLYDVLFDNDQHFLLVCVENSNPDELGDLFYFRGTEIVDVMDTDMIETLRSNIDRYWFSDLYTIEEVFSYSFINLAFELVNISSEEYFDYFSSAEGQWVEDEGGRFYQMNDGSHLVNSWMRIGGYQYYFDGRGYRFSGWLLLEEGWYYLDETGIMTKGWFNEDEVWYYFGRDGVLVTGWQEIGGSSYYFDELGRLLTDEWSSEEQDLAIDDILE